MAVFTLNYVNIYTDYTYLEINSIFKIQKYLLNISDMEDDILLN